MEEVIFGVSIFLGLWLSWTVGYNLHDWVKGIFSYRVKVTDTHVEFTAATPVEIKQEYETYGTLPVCHICGLADLSRSHYHRRDPNPILDEMDTGQEADLLEDVESPKSEVTVGEVLSNMTDEQRDALYFLLGAALEQVQDEEYEEIKTFDGNLRYVSRRPTSRRPPYYDHLDL